MAGAKPATKTVTLGRWIDLLLNVHLKRPRFGIRDTDSCPDRAFVERFRKVTRVSFAALPTFWLGATARKEHLKRPWLTAVASRSGSHPICNHNFGRTPGEL